MATQKQLAVGCYDLAMLALRDVKGATKEDKQELADELQEVCESRVTIICWSERNG